MGGDPVPNAIEQAMDRQFVDNTLSEYIINWGFHNNAGKDGNTSKKPIITVDSCQLAERSAQCSYQGAQEAICAAALENG
ncbi:hypothetical protein C356_01811 [Cryptococcus neoformans c45]|nr:hypothetical protein C356_01811 [Cryptococcus neoformans var. grubii c45]